MPTRGGLPPARAGRGTRCRVWCRRGRGGPARSGVRRTAASRFLCWPALHTPVPRRHARPGSATPSRWPAVCVRPGRAGHRRSPPRSTALRPRPRRLKVILIQSISYCRNGGVVVGVVDLESHQAHALTHRLRRAEKTRSVVMTTAVGAQTGDDLEMSGKATKIPPSAALASASKTSRSASSRSPCVSEIRARVVNAATRCQPCRRRDGLVGVAAGRVEIPSCQRNFGHNVGCM